MKESPTCEVCGKRAEVIAKYQTDKDQRRLCLGCVTTYRLNGRRVHLIRGWVGA